MEQSTGRRRFLELASAGTALSIAGCSGLQADGGDGNGTDGGDGPSGDRATVGLAVQPDQEALQQRRSEIAGQNMSQQEQQVALQQAQTELVTAAVEEFQTQAEENPDLDVEDALPQFGAVKVSGTPAALVGTLSTAVVSALLPVAQFDQARQQVNAQGGGGGGNQTTADATNQSG